ncbi:MAG: DUF2788 domain-containing protein [Pseudomonadales bacterium]|nr:DUF2788 domain-containing protein [Pseudomonadales bacterium]
MDVQQFETISLYVCVSGLILYMLFIMFKLAQESQAGKIGTLAIFGCLGMGILGFVIKEVLTVVIQV